MKLSIIKDVLFDKRGFMRILDSDSYVTRKVKKDWNEMSDLEFLYKYAATKDVYAKRVLRYVDPYMNSPLAKLGKFLSKHM